MCKAKTPVTPGKGPAAARSSCSLHTWKVLLYMSLKNAAHLDLYSLSSSLQDPAD